MQRYSILWADDEIDLLKPHILFLQQRGYDITPVNNGAEAVELSESRNFDVVFEPTDRKSLAGFSPTRNHLLLNELDNVRNRLMILTRKDGTWKREELPGVPALTTAWISVWDSGRLYSEISSRAPLKVRRSGDEPSHSAYCDPVRKVRFAVSGPASVP